MEGVIEIGKLKRIQASVNQYFANKSRDVNSKFDWDFSIKFINRGKGGLLPVVVDSNIIFENPTNIFHERLIIENKLKKHFLKPYN